MGIFIVKIEIKLPDPWRTIEMINGTWLPCDKKLKLSIEKLFNFLANRIAR